MKKLSLLLLSLVLFSQNIYSQVITRSWDLKATTVSNACGDDATKTCSPPENIGNRGLSSHIFTWSLQSGVVSSCILSFQTSPDNKSTSIWTEQTTGDCSATGTTSYLSFATNFIRVKLKTISVTSGTLNVTVNYAGYVNNPASNPTSITPTSINNIQYCNNYTGASASVKITNCIAAIASTGGRADATGIQGAQSWTTDAFSGVTKPVDFECGATTYTVSATSTIPANVTSYLGQGCQFSVNAGVTLTINGPLNVSPTTAHFVGSGTINLQSYAVSYFIDVNWYNTKHDGSTNDDTALNNAIAVANGVTTTFGGGASIGAVIKAGPGVYVVTNLNPITSTGVHFEGSGKENTVFVTTSATGAVFTCGNGSAIHDVFFSKFSIRASPARSVGAVGIKVNGCGNSVSDDIGLFDQPIGFQMTDTGTALLYDITNSRIECTTQSNGIGVDIAAVGVRVRHTFIAGTTSFSGDNACFAGVRMTNTNNSFIDDRSWIQYFKWGVLIIPSTGQTVTQSHLENISIEGCTHEGIGIEPSGDGTAIVYGITINGIRVDRPFSSSIGAGPGIYIHDSASPANSIIRGIDIKNNFIYGNGQEGGIVGPGNNLRDIQITNNTIGDNSTVSSGVYAGWHFTAAMSHWSFNDNKCGYTEGQSNTQKYCLLVDAGASDNYIISNNDMTGNITAKYSDGGTGSSKIISNNLPYTNCVGTSCSDATSGMASITAATTTVTISTTAVTANSEIFIQEDATLGTRLSVTCNTTTGRSYTVTTRTAGTSFIVTASAAPVTNPACLNFWILN